MIVYIYIGFKADHYLNFYNLFKLLLNTRNEYNPMLIRSAPLVNARIKSMKQLCSKFSEWSFTSENLVPKDKCLNCRLRSDRGKGVVNMFGTSTVHYFNLQVVAGS